MTWWGRTLRLSILPSDSHAKARRLFTMYLVRLGYSPSPRIPVDRLSRIVRLGITVLVALVPGKVTVLHVQVVPGTCTVFAKPACQRKAPAGLRSQDYHATANDSEVPVFSFYTCFCRPDSPSPKCAN